MLRFNVQQAKKDGFSDEEITRMIQQGPPMQAQAVKNTPAQGGQGNLLTALLPLLGSLVGGGIGAVGGPAGIIAGSAAGSGLGEAARQSFSGEQFSGGKVFGETALGALGGGAGLLLGRGARAAKAAKAVGAVDDVASTGTRIAGRPYTGEAVKKLRGKNISSRAADISDTATGLGGRTAPQKLDTLGKEREALLTTLRDLTTNPKSASYIGDTTVEGKKLYGTVKTALEESAVDLNSGAGKALNKTWGKKIQNTKNVKELSENIKGILGRANELGARSQEGRVLKVMARPLEQQLHQIAGTEEAFARLSKLNAAEPIIQSQAGKQARVLGIYETQLPFRAQEAAQGVIGRGTDIATSPMAKQLYGQVGTRAVGGGFSGGDYVPPEAAGSTAQDYMQEPMEQTLDEGTPAFDITTEQVALARLTLPDKQADAIEAAYKILHPDGGSKKDRTEAQIARDEMGFLIDSATNQLSAGNIKTGPISPRVEEIKSIFNAGDQSTIDFNRTISALTAAIAKARAGTSFTANEQALLERYAPKIGDSEQQLYSKLQGLKSIRLNAD